MSSKPNSNVETISPSQAVSWLEKNYAHQRAIRNRDVARYAVMMREGRWKLTHQGIAFSDTGRLLDGQHRLWAIIEAEVPVTMMVTRGLSEDSFTALDQNRVRSVSDLAADPDITPAVTAIAKSGARGPSQNTLSPFFDDRDNELMLRFIDEHRARLLQVVQLKSGGGGPSDRGGGHRRGVGALKSPVMGLLFRASFHIPWVQIERFAEILITGHVTDPHGEAAAILLRDFLLKSVRGKDLQSEIYQKTQRALHAWLSSDPISTLYVMPDDLYPLPGKIDPRVVKRIGAAKRIVRVTATKPVKAAPHVPRMEKRRRGAA